MADAPKPYLNSRLYGRLRNELRRVAADPAQVNALRELLNGRADDDPYGLLPNSKMRSWLLRGNKERLPNVAVEGAAIGMKICLDHLSRSGEFTPQGFLDGPQDSPTGSLPSDDGAAIPHELLTHHLDALKTTWLYGDYSLHAVRIADPAENGDGLDAKIWRFFSGLRTVPPEFEPRIEKESTHFVHGSALDHPNSIMGMPIAFGLEGRDGEIIPEPEDNPSQVHFLVRLMHGDAPLTCGYSYGVSQRFLRYETAQRFDAFSSTNAVVLRQGVVVVSFPAAQFGHLKSASGVLFATPIPMLPRVYVEKVADKAARNILGRRHGLYSTWAKPVRIEENLKVVSASALWEFAGLTTPSERANFIDDSIETLFGPDRVVFATRFILPNPLAYQSLMWKLPEKGI